MPLTGSSLQWCTPGSTGTIGVPGGSASGAVALGGVVVLTYTVWQYDLGFRAYDPFYILFTGARGHGTAPWSIT